MGRSTGIMITEGMAFPGMRVCRGRDWKWLTQDEVNGVQQPGTIRDAKISTDGWVSVLWDNQSNTRNYRVGGASDGVSGYDLYLWEDDNVSQLTLNSSVVGGMLSSGSGLKKGDKVVLFIETTYSKYEGLTKGTVYTVKDLDGARPNYIKVVEGAQNYWVEITSFARYVGDQPYSASIPAVPTGPLITDNKANWDVCPHLIKVGMEVMVINDTLSSWVKAGGLKIGDVVKVTGTGTSSFTVNTPIHGNLSIDKRCFGLPSQGVIGSVFINRKIKITANERRTSPRGIQVRRQTPSVRSAKTGSGRAVRG